MERQRKIGEALKRVMEDREREELERRITEAERRCDVEIVLAVTLRSDSYAEIPWKAFALGAAVGGAKAAAVALWNPVWLPNHAAVLAAAAPLAGGLLGLLAALLVRPFARLLLDPHRAEAETRQYAQSLFLERELFATRRRCAVLLLASLFERRVVLLPDKGLAARLDHAGMKRVVNRVTARLRRGRVGEALEEGILSLEEALAASPGGGPAANELSDRIITEAGA